jgi:hypothetical protein
VRLVSSQVLGNGVVLSISVQPRKVAGKAVQPVAVAVPAAAMPVPRSLRTFCLVSVLLTAIGVGAVYNGNKAYGPEMYAGGMRTAAEAFAQGKNYAVFDLNLNIRQLREEHVARMTETPDVVLLGASHWQEAHAGLLPQYKMYNSHIHRDYWEDPLGVIEIWAKHNRLPKKMIIAIRDNQFMPVDERKDFLWEPGIPFYQAFAKRIGFETEPFWKTLPYARMKQLFSISMLMDNFTRWQKASQFPQASTEKHFKSLDTLLPDGSILWSDDHMKVFTPERTRHESETFADFKIKHPPTIDPKGVDAFDRMLTFLQDKGVEVTLVHPPYNPQFWNKVKGTAYMPAMEKVRDVAKSFAAKFDLSIIGGFDPESVGCTADMYIDSEHSNPACLQKIFDQFTAVDSARGKSS